MRVERKSQNKQKDQIGFDDQVQYTRSGEKLYAEEPLMLSQITLQPSSRMCRFRSQVRVAGKAFKAGGLTRRGQRCIACRIIVAKCIADESF